MKSTIKLNSLNFRKKLLAMHLTHDAFCNRCGVKKGSLSTWLYNPKKTGISASNLAKLKDFFNNDRTLFEKRC